MEQNNNAWAKQLFKLHRNSGMAKQNLTKAKSDFNNNKNEITYKYFIPVSGNNYFINVIKNFVYFYVIALIYFLAIFLFNIIMKEPSVDLFYFLLKPNTGIPFFCFVCLASLIVSTSKIIVVSINRKNKIVRIKKFITFWKKIQFEWHSNNYLPELSLPETEQEKYKEMQQNLQQAIALETGLKFDTQQFLLQNKGKLGI